MTKAETATLNPGDLIIWQDMNAHGFRKAWVQGKVVRVEDGRVWFYVAHIDRVLSRPCGSIKRAS